MKKRLHKLVKPKVFTHIVLPIILLVVLVFIGYSSLRGTKKMLNKEDAIVKTEDFINNFLMQSGNKASVQEITSEYGLYKLKVDIVSDVVESYLTKDGKLFFPQALIIDEIANSKTASPSGDTNIATDVPKSDKPVVELFIMSYCPYGTQMQKGILPVLETLGDKIDFELKFVDYIMHGEQEITENLVQYCIQEEQSDKLNDYLTCFLKEGKSDECVTATKINTKKLNSCVAKTDDQYDVTNNYTNKVGYRGSYPGFDVNKTDTAKYSVNGSPTLIINGQDIQSGRDSASLLGTICNAFENQPKECQTELPSASPTPGFGSGTTANSAAATCN